MHINYFTAYLKVFYSLIPSGYEKKKKIDFPVFTESNDMNCGPIIESFFPKS